MTLSGDGQALKDKYGIEPIKTTHLDDEGTTEFSDGVKIHWTEGRDTHHTIERPDGTSETTIEVTPYLEFMIAGEYGKVN